MDNEIRAIYCPLYSNKTLPCKTTFKPIKTELLFNTFYFNSNVPLIKFRISLSAGVTIFIICKHQTPYTIAYNASNKMYKKHPFYLFFFNVLNQRKGAIVEGDDVPIQYNVL